MTLVTVARGHPEAVAAMVDGMKMDGRETSELVYVEHDENGEDHSVRWNVSEDAQWAWVRAQIAIDVEKVAKKLGVSPKALTRFVDDNAVVKLSVLLDAYKRRTRSEETESKTITKTETAWIDFCRVTEAMTTEDLTIVRILSFRDWVNAQPQWKKPKTRSLVIQRVKAVVNAAVAEGKNVGTLATDLKVLNKRKSKKSDESINPTPMTRESFKALLGAADVRMKAMLLCGLNFCMYLKEVFQLKWADLKDGGTTMVCHRGKTGVVRAAVLWPETIEALKAIERKGETVFVSQHGCPYHVESARKPYGDHRRRCNIEHAENTEWAAIRDAAYTTSSRNVLLQQAQVLAGHKIGGLTDPYIARNPSYVADACEAIRVAYIA